MRLVQLLSEPAAWLARAVLFIGLAMATGTIVFRAWLLRALERDPQRFRPVAEEGARRARLVGLWTLTALVPVVAWRIALQSSNVSDTPERWHEAVPSVLHTMWGRAWSVQALVLGIALIVAAVSRTGRVSQAVLAALVAALCATPALSGHAVASSVPGLAVAGDVVHVIAGGVWLGTLALLAVAGVPAARLAADTDTHVRAVSVMVDAFSPIALGSAALIAVTGVLASWMHLDRVDALWRTPYGQRLLVKLAALTIVVAAAAWNWRRAKPRLLARDRSPRDVRHLRCVAGLELAGGLAVIAATAALVSTPPPGE